MKVFFVFREVHVGEPRLYTLWGKTTIRGVDSCPGADGCYFVHFHEFRPAARGAWITGLTARQIVGGEFGSGLYRYVPNAIADVLDSMI
jgi:hypothetical protein